MSDAPLPPPPSEGFTPPPPPVGFPPPPPPPGAPPPPPGYGAYPTGYGYASGPHEAARSLSGLAVALSVLLPIAALANLIFAVALFNRASVLDTDFTGSDLVDADNAVGGGVALVFFAVVPTAIVWIIWQYRHAQNAPLLGKTGGLGPGWAIGGWFVPIGNFVLPQLELVQSAKASDPDAPARPGRAPAAVYVWWLLFDLQAVISIASGRYGSDDSGAFTQIDDFQRTDRIAAVGALVSVAAAIAAVVVVRALTARQRRALEGRGLAPGPTPTTF
jgi:hypothetical protein